MAADVMPLRAAGPGLKRFCIDGPYISISPDAWAPARPRAETVWSLSSPISRAAAIVAPNTPQVGVEWKPRLRKEKLVALLTRAIISQPATTAATNSSPVDLDASAAA